MFNKISFKLGVLFLSIFFVLEGILFVFLYSGFLFERMQAETDALLSRGNSHRDVLINHFDRPTIDHVALMESEAETMVVITDQSKNVLAYSNPLNSKMTEIINQEQNINKQGLVVKGNWEAEPYLATVSPIIQDQGVKGYVYMFLDTNSIREVRDNLAYQFLIVGALAIIISLVTVFFLSRFLADPLIKMKEATKKLSRGKHDVQLASNRSDELGELARSIQTLSDDLYRLKNERTDFLASISHELRTPLTYLKGYADIAQRPLITAEERGRYLSIIQEESGHIANLVKDLFEMAKMDQHGFKIEKQEVNLCSLLQLVISKIKPAYDEKEVRLHVECKDYYKVNVDPERFEQVILNLLDNSLHFTAPYKRVKVNVEERSENLSFSVIDEGEGIPEKDLPYIWDRLYRVDKSRSRKYGGSGLGLSIAKEIVEKHGGTIEAKSEIGLGTEITILLPGKDVSIEKGTDRRR
ncbi:sensor histidine kinase [Pseudalkalibacillus caeni]|uniref:histidine kinase n=1 Tax=Exobacillus caeni TaxID=2574798 RepID=A0A5R9F4L8_9BACL|nr:HAMP domain-containing sensor histidine kinase [Pseudalkalibacillus caeni]TLS35434.1 HAMP domain-containing histidine kinase [Pseudalkalibacillus caeni]